MTSSQINSQSYGSARNDAVDRMTAYQYRRVFNRFITEAGVAVGDSILDIRVNSRSPRDASNYLDTYYPHKQKVTIVNIDSSSLLNYPCSIFSYDRRPRLPFRDGAFDIVHSFGLIQQVRSLDAQRLFVQECCRLARRVVFIAITNKLLQITFPKQIVRHLQYYPRNNEEEQHLYSVTKARLRDVTCGFSDFDICISSVLLGAWSSTLLLTMRRRKDFFNE
jgi:hypothetical protein